MIVQIFFGWPAIVASLGIAVAGIIRRRPFWILAAMVVLALPTWYLTMTPRFRSAALLAGPLFQLGAFLILRAGKRGLAAALLLPGLLFYGWVAKIVIQQ